eukprot:CAMPEP_0203774006 /NCGR_PEP_ID=MMETSP0099_2-20121227/5008_1 /ASSEMBLY_ACC=CAM_ASM_000209 /TAXON_ID=96639 /ORGANISM=" , Strain NY0313808BC1" /LENGTH=215 /DNA_ID=CAMNT_0050671969 /DNA_START=269 /DNA_END=916 /DNA_ORIENTATION=+
MDRLANMVNSSFEKYPRETLGAMLAMEIVSIYGTHKLLVYSGIHVPAAFALAFAMGRPLRRARLPLELAGAALLSRLVPQLTHIRLTNALSGAVPSTARQKWQSWKSNEKFKWGGEKISQMIDRYGAAYFISARWVGAAVVFGIYGGLVSGWDVSGTLKQYGIEEFGSVMGTWAAAVSTSACLYPVTILCGAGLGPVVGRGLYFAAHLVRKGRRF